MDAASLLEAVARIERGQVDADLGGGVIKQRIARPGRGRSGGYRTLVLVRAAEMAVFAYGFAKSDRGNVRADEMDALRVLAGTVLAYREAEVARAVGAGELIEVRVG